MSKTKTDFLEIDTGTPPVDLAIRHRACCFLGRSLLFPNPITAEILTDTWHSHYKRTTTSTALRLYAEPFLNVIVSGTSPHAVAPSDSLASSSQSNLFFDYTDKIGISVFKSISLQMMADEWQSRWDNERESIFKSLYPHVKNKTILPFNNNRKINRLRYGKTHINRGTTFVGIGQNCSACGVALDVKHLLLFCNTSLSSKLNKYCNSHKIDPNITNILSNADCISIILAANL